MKLNLLRIAIQQTRALNLTLEALEAVEPPDIPCEHPKEKIVTVGTMGNTTRICSICQQEVTEPGREAAS